jgi:hypothetical protein
MNLFSKMWCKLFGCQDFVDLKADVAQVKADLATVVIAVTGIAGQFPITIPAPVVDFGDMPAQLDALVIPDMEVWADCVDVAVQNDVVRVGVWAKGTAGSQIDAFGFGPAGFVFDPAHFSYVNIIRGADTVPWNTLDANEVNPGELTVGAFAGAARSLIGDKPMHLFTIELSVVAATTVTSTIRLDNFVDDIVDFVPKPLTFTIDLN